MIEYTTIVGAAIIGIVPAIVIGWWFVIKKNRQFNLSIQLFLTTFFWGVLTAVPASIFQIVNMEGDGGNKFVALFQNLNIFQGSYFMAQTIAPLLFVAIIEELSKGFGVVLALRYFAKSKKASLLKVNPGLIAGVIVGLAFGVTENGVYFANNFDSQVGSSMAQIVILRFVLSTSAHIIYTGLLGTFLIEMMLSGGIIKKFSRMLLMLIVPIAIHTGFNVLVSGEYGWLSIPLVISGAGLLVFKAFWRLR